MSLCPGKKESQHDQSDQDDKEPGDLHRDYQV